MYMYIILYINNLNEQQQQLATTNKLTMIEIQNKK